MPSIPTFLAATIFQKNFSRLSTQIYDLQTQTSTGAKANDLVGYGARAGSIISAKSVIADNESRIAASARLGARLSMQDISLSQAAEAIANLREGVSTAAISGQESDIIAKLRTALSQVTTALNASHEGRFMFGGERTDAAPINVDSLEQLDAIADVSTIFRESQRDAYADLGGGISLKLSERASTFATQAFQAIKDLYATVKDVTVGGTLTDTQKLRLSALDPSLGAAQVDVLGAQGRNGVSQHRLEAESARLNSNNATIRRHVGEITDADLAEVAVQLSAVKTQYEAAAQVYSQMRELTLVNFLR